MAVSISTEFMLNEIARLYLETRALAKENARLEEQIQLRAAEMKAVKAE